MWIGFRFSTGWRFPLTDSTDWPTLALLLFLLPACEFAFAKDAARKEDLWSLKPIVRPQIPQGVTSSSNPIDAFIEKRAVRRSCRPLGWRTSEHGSGAVSFDLIAAPSVEERKPFSENPPMPSRRSWNGFWPASNTASACDVIGWTFCVIPISTKTCRRAGIHWWRDWIITRSMMTCRMTSLLAPKSWATGCPTPHHFRGWTSHPGRTTPGRLIRAWFSARRDFSRRRPELALSAVETISHTFLGMTVGCAMCHDHFYDPIRQTDYYQ
jgi:hypothetical protein